MHPRLSQSTLVFAPPVTFLGHGFRVSGRHPAHVTRNTEHETDMLPQQSLLTCLFMRRRRAGLCEAVWTATTIYAHLRCAIQTAPQWFLLEEGGLDSPWCALDSKLVYRTGFGSSACPLFSWPLHLVQGFF